MTSENIAFYARLKDVQELQHKREQKRIDLQRKFDNHASSDHQLSRLRATRLQSYWKKVCENERRSKARNEQLLRDFERVEAHIATLSSRTQRLKLLKDQYEQQVEAMYPYWKEQMEIKRQSQMKQGHHPAQVSSSFASSHEQYSGQILSQPSVPLVIAQNGMNGTFSNTPGQQYPHMHTPNQVNPVTQSLAQPYHHPQEFSRPQGPSASAYHHPPSSTPSTIPKSNLHYPHNAMMYGQEQNQAAAPQGIASGGHLEGHPNRRPLGAVGGLGRLPSGGVVSAQGPQAGYGQAEDSTTISISSETASSPSHQLKPGATSSAGAAKDSTAAQLYIHQELQSHEESKRPEGLTSKEMERSGLQGKAPVGSKPATDQNHHRDSTSVTVDKLPSAQTEPFSSGDEFDDHIGSRADSALYSPEVPPALPKYEEGEIPPATGVSNTAIETASSKGAAGLQPSSDSEESSGSEEDSEADSDLSLPLSDTNARDTGTKPLPAVRLSVKAEESAPKAAEANPITLSLNGFWLLLKAVEAEIDETDSLEGIYASLPCTKAIRDEIVRTANSKSGFDRLDPRAISMVILEELPLLVRQLPGGCLLSERLLLASSRTITEVSIRSHMYSSALTFWDDILRHMVFLVRRGVMEPEAVAAKFAPLLVAADSKAVDKAVNVMSDILLKAEEEEEEVTLGDESSLTATSPMSPDNPAAAPSPVIPPRTQQEKPREYPSVPPLALGGMEGDTDDLVDTGRTSSDSFFDSKVPLTETDAYQRMMMSTQPEEAKGDDDDDSGEDDEDDSEDEIEKATRIKQDSPSSQQTKKKRNVLSSLGGSLGMSLDGADEPGEATGARDQGIPLPSDRTDEVSSPDKSDLSTTPQGTGGYVPTAMEQSMKSTGRTDTMNRSAAFWGNESDLDEESEMSVPMGTGKVDEEKDDFDFYD